MRPCPRMLAALPALEQIGDRFADELAKAGLFLDGQVSQLGVRFIVEGHGRSLHLWRLRRLYPLPPPHVPPPLPRGSRHTAILQFHRISVKFGGGRGRPSSARGRPPPPATSQARSRA